jgi:Zn-dependent protease
MTIPMRLSWKLGRVAGIDLFLHPSALLLFFLVSGAMPSGFETLAFVAALLGSIVLHELGHSLMARRYGIETADITLYLFGGVARLERMPRSPGPELLIALAGPAVNFAIAGALFAMVSLTEIAGLPSMFLWQILITNLLLACFNLLPIFPMDGGRVLRAFLSGWVGRRRATEVAAMIGRMVAVVGGIVFLFNGMWQLVVLTLFVFMAGGMELRQVRAEGRSPGVPEGFADGVAAPVGYRWATRGDGVWRLVPIMVPVGGRDRSWS